MGLGAVGEITCPGLGSGVCDWRDSSELERSVMETVRGRGKGEEEGQERART